MKKQQGFGLAPVLIVIALVLAGGGAYLYTQHKGPFLPNAQMTDTTTGSTQTTPTSPTPTNHTPSPTPTTHADSSFSALPTSGASPLKVNFVYSFDINAAGGASSEFMVDFGDGTQSPMTVTDTARVSHTYTAAGVYTATVKFKNVYEDTPNYVFLTDRYGNRQVQTITVTGGPTSGAASATIDQSSLMVSTGGKGSTGVTITGSAMNTDHVLVFIKDGATEFANVVNGRWSATTHGFLSPKTYAVEIRNENSHGNNLEEVLATGTLTVTQ